MSGPQRRVIRPIDVEAVGSVIVNLEVGHPLELELLEASLVTVGV